MTMHSICSSTNFSYKEKEMSTNSISSLASQSFPVNPLNELVYQQPYFNTTRSLKKQLTEAVGHRLASAWLDLWDMSYSGKKLINLSYSYLAKIWFYSRRNAIRVAQDLEKYGFVAKTVTKMRNGLNHVNKYRVCTPDEVLKLIQGFRKRKQIVPNIDYSVQHEDIPEVKEEVGLSGNPGQPPIRDSRIANDQPETQERETSKPGDTRGLLKLDVPLVSGPLGNLLLRMKDKFKPGPKPKCPGEPFYVECPEGGSDRTVTQRALSIKSNKGGLKTDLPITFEKVKRKKKEPTRQVSDETLAAIDRYVYGNRDISYPKQLYKEIEWYIATNPQMSEIYAINAAKSIIQAGNWRTPWGMKYDHHGKLKPIDFDEDIDL